MKSCPTCSRTFDDTFTFCLVDGAILSAPYDPQATQRIPDVRVTIPSPTETLPHAASKVPDTTSSPSLYPTIQAPPPPPRSFRSVSEQEHPLRQGINKRWLTFGITAGIVMIVGLIIAVSQITSSNSNNSIATTADNNSNVSNNDKATRTENSNTPQRSPSTSQELDVIGTWKGTFGSKNPPGTLIINSLESDGSYSGTLTAGESVTEVLVVVHVDSATRTIAFDEIRILKGGPWNLGKNKGSVSINGETMSGDGKDTAGSTYSWSFTKTN